MVTKMVMVMNECTLVNEVESRSEDNYMRSRTIAIWLSVHNCGD